MPIYITPKKVKMRQLDGNHSNQFYGLDVVAAETTAEHVAAINSAADEAEGRVNDTINTVTESMNNLINTTTNDINETVNTATGNVNDMTTTVNEKSAQLIEAASTLEDALESVVGSLEDPTIQFPIDNTLTLAGSAADAKATSDAIKATVKVSSTQPQEDCNRLWIHENAETETEIPTYEEFNDLKSAVNDMTFDIINSSAAISGGKMCNWKKATYAIATGEYWASERYITNKTVQGVPTGIKRITSDGVRMYILAWDTEGIYIGFYNSNEEFSKVSENYATWTEFDCTDYPDYVFRVVATLDPNSSSITPDDGDKVTFHSMVEIELDTTLTAEGKAPESKTVGDRINAAEKELRDGAHNASCVVASGKLSGWVKGTYATSNGKFFTATKQITNTSAQGVPTGVTRITLDGLVAYILAWDTDGNYIGFYNSNEEFSKVGANYATWTDFDCTDYPNYVIRVVAQFDPQSTEIAPSDGEKITFQCTDTSLLLSNHPADSKAVGDAMHELEEGFEDEIKTLVTGKRTDWEKSTYGMTTGEKFSSTTQITIAEPQGISTGVKGITVDGLLMYIVAWDLNGNFMGHYNSDREFSTAGAKYATWTEFDCAAYPNYVVRPLCKFDPASTSITPADGSNVTFHYFKTDKTLTEASVPADAKVTGDAIRTMQSDKRTEGIYYKMSAADLESGYWAYSTKSSNTKRLRNSVLYKVRKGMSIRYTNPTQKVYVGVLQTETSNAYLQSSGWISAGVSNGIYYIEYDGYMTFMVESVSDITPADYACTVIVQNEIIYDNCVESIRKDLFKMFKRVGVCGDSISVGYIQDRSAVTTRNLAYSWPKGIMQDANGTPWLNFGTSGQTTLTWASSSTYGKVQLEAENNKCQAYVICLGANDEWNNNTLGTTNDIVDNPDTTATTFYGGYNRIIQIIKRKNADAKIFCCTMPVAVESKGFNDAVRYIATTHYNTSDNVFLVELAKNYKQFFLSSDFGIYTDKMNSDTVNHGHYSPLGYRLIATLMENILNEVIFKNQLYFMDIADIPYDIASPTTNTMTE